MNALPDYIVIDFLEWLSNRKKKAYIYDDLIELGEDSLRMHWRELYDLAERFIKEKYTVQGVLSRFINSKEFKNILKKETIYHCDVDEICFYNFDSLFNYVDLAYAFKQFYDREHLHDLNPNQNPDYLMPEYLVDGLRQFIGNKNIKSRACKFWVLRNENLSLEIDFLEWLMKTSGEKIDLSKMPLSKFIKLASDYCTSTHGSKQDINKLVASFKYSDVESFGRKLLSKFSTPKAKRLKSLRYIFDRYTNDQIPYRCIFLPLGSEIDEFKNLIDVHYDDLNHLSGDYLDIYYSVSDLDKSGYEIKNNMHSLPNSLSERLPCIVLWEHDLESAKTIDIFDLSNIELVRLMSFIIDSIKEEKSFDSIVKEATKKADEIRKEHIDSKRPITNNTFNVENNTGVIAGNIANSTVNVKSGSISKETFESESKKAIEIISTFKEVEEGYRNTLIELVKEANASVQNIDEAGQKMCKSNFEFFIKGAGKAVGQIVTKLAELAAIAAFFGISASTFIH